MLKILPAKNSSKFLTPFAEALNQLKVGESQAIPLQGRRRVKCQKSQYLNHGFACSFILMEELTKELRVWGAGQKRYPTEQVAFTFQATILAHKNYS